MNLRSGRVRYSSERTEADCGSLVRLRRLIGGIEKLNEEGSILSVAGAPQRAQRSNPDSLVCGSQGLLAQRRGHFFTNAAALPRSGFGRTTRENIFARNRAAQAQEVFAV
ncbi:MAG: hypothetical protein AAF471_08810 [Myxococcota bacterium]